MKFSVKLKKLHLFKRSSQHWRKKLSNHQCSVVQNAMKKINKQFRFSSMKKLIWLRKKNKSKHKLSVITSSPAVYIEELEHEFINTLKKLSTQSQIPKHEDEKHSATRELFSLNNSGENPNEEWNQDKKAFYASKRLLMTRSLNDFSRIMTQSCVYYSSSSQRIHQSNVHHSETAFNARSTGRKNRAMDPLIQSSRKKNATVEVILRSDSCLKGSSSSMNSKLSVHSNKFSLPLAKQGNDAAIIDVEHQSYSSTASSVHYRKRIEKSFSSPLPMNKNNSFADNIYIRSAHILNQYECDNKNDIYLSSFVSEMESDESTESSTSDEENIKHGLLHHNESTMAKNIRHRWSLFDTWDTTIDKLPPIANCIWRQQLHYTGSREFFLEYDRALPMNNNNNNRVYRSQEQRYVEQERPINSYFGVALFALLVFPPVGIVALIFSLWSLCGQQDRHLSRKFGNAAYWISLLAICFSFMFLFTLFIYFTYQYLINQTDSTATEGTDYS